MKIHIRQAEKSDAKTLFDFICELEETTFLFSEFEPLYITNLIQTDFIYLVATDETNTVVGYISCHGQVLLHHCGKVFEIQELFVKNSCRGKGIGQQLIHSLEHALRRYDCKSFEVTANIKRTDTHEFYKKSGFIHTHLKFIKP